MKSNTRIILYFLEENTVERDFFLDSYVGSHNSQQYRKLRFFYFNKGNAELHDKRVECQNRNSKQQAKQIREIKNILFFI